MRLISWRTSSPKPPTKGASPFGNPFFVSCCCAMRSNKKQGDFQGARPLNRGLGGRSPSTLKLILLLLLCFSAACSKKPPPAKRSYPVNVGTVQMKTAPLYIEALGHVEPIISVQVRSRIEGELMDVYFVEGQEVKRDDLMFTIDPRPYEASLKNAQGALDRALAELALSEEKVKRYAQLTRDEYYSQIDYETLQSSYAANLAAVQQAQADVDSAALNLEYCWIYAPIDGLTGILQIDKGNLVSADGPQQLITLNQMAPIYVTFSIPEMQLSIVRKANAKSALKVLAAFESFQEECFEGTLQMFDNMVDSKTGMINLRATYENDDRSLWPGQFVRIRLITGQMQNAILIPYTAIQLTQAGPVVYVLKADNTVEIRNLELGQREDENIIVLKGLQGNETIVIEGQMNLFNGASVYVPSPEKS